MTIGSITSATRIFSQIESQRQLFDSLYRPSAFQALLDQHKSLTHPSMLQTMLDQEATQDRLFGLRAPSMVEQIVHDHDRLDRMFKNPIQPTALQAMIDQQKTSSQLLGLGASSSMLKAVVDAQGKQPGLFSSLQGTFQFRHSDLLRISEAAGGDRFKMRQDLFQGMADQLALGTMKSWPSINFPPGFAKALSGYEDGLVAKYAEGVIAEVEAAADTVTETDFVDDEAAVWFGAESWSALVWEMVTILKALELATAGMWAAKGILKAPIPLNLLYLAAMAVVAGELAARFAERAAKRLDGDED